VSTPPRRIQHGALRHDAGHDRGLQGVIMPSRPESLSDNVACLVPVHGTGDRRSRRLESDVSTIGRARGCDLCLDASDVSTIHCVVYRGLTGYYVRDCNSRSGTRVNGDEIRTVRPLREGDILQVGPFSFEAHVPRRFASPGETLLERARLQRLGESRQRLAGHALRLRRLLRERSLNATTAGHTELQPEVAHAREMARAYEQRLRELNDAEREFQTEREHFRAHVQKAENVMAQRLEEAEQQVRARWQEFQRRCAAEEAEQNKPQLQAALAQQQAALTQQEAALRGQRAEVAKMLNELRSLQETMRQPIEAQLEAVSAENEQLRLVVAELEARAIPDAGADSTGAADSTGPAGSADAGPKLRDAHAEIELLRMMLQQRETEMEELRARPAQPAAKSSADLEHYEADLNQERQELERERSKLNAELEQMRVRNDELDEAIREMEMQMSRERADLGRERMRLERMRDDLRTDMEKSQREMGVRESLASVSRLREELKGTAAKADPAAERLRQLRASNDTPRD
jgi:chromosome segregation ATPase